MSEVVSGDDAVKKYGSSVLSVILTVSLAAGILFPSILYGILLRPRSASDVLVASSVCLFASVVYLWTLHAISIISFRDPWMGKAIFGAAITGILGTSAVIYKSQLSNSFPFVGKWDMAIQRFVGDNTVCVWSGKILLVNNTSTNTYTGLAEDATDTSNACPYGVKDIIRIEWNDQLSTIDLVLINFPASSSHVAENAAPQSLTFRLKQDGSRWVSEKSADKTNSSAFIVSLVRSI
jgi:hypothetical protein